MTLDRTPVFLGRLNPGARLQIESRDAFQTYISQLEPREGFVQPWVYGEPPRAFAVVELRVRPYVPGRTLAQNRDWWGNVVRPCAEHTGYHLREMHDELKLRLLPAVDSRICPACLGSGFDLDHPDARSTRELSTLAYPEVRQEAAAWAQDYLGLRLPDPRGD